MISSLMNTKGRAADHDSVLRKLLSNLRADGPQTLGVVTCCDSGEMRIASELAHLAAQSGGTRVLSIQMRPPAGASQVEPGWREFVAGDADLDDVVHLDPASKVSTMPAGATCRVRQSEQSRRAALSLLQHQFDLIVVELATISNQSTADLAADLDGVVLVLEGRRTSREAAQQVKRRLQRAGARVLGAVFDGRHTPTQGSANSSSAPTANRPRTGRRWLSVFGRVRPACRSSLAVEPDFRAAIELERMRSDRSGLPFSLLIHASGSSELVGRTLSRFSRIVLGRIRATDTAGWIDAHRTAVLLPDTGGEGAAKLAADLTQLLEEAGIAASWKVRTYLPQPPASRIPPGGSLETSVSETQVLLDDQRQPAAGAAQALDVEAMFAQVLPRWKRWLDVAGAIFGLLLLSPLLAISVVAIRLTSRGPAVFTQMRSGLGGRPFRMYKLRSMYVDAEQRQAELRPLSEQDGPAFKLKDDPRITPVGRFLRRTSIDELPQLWNVLLGDMTLVGPRPLPMEETAGCQSWHRRRLLATPGLTCIWQVSGRSQVAFDEWMRMDLRYVRRRTLLGDVKLILQTIPAVLLRRGAQ